MKFLRLLCFLIIPVVLNAQTSSSTKPDPAPLKELVRAYMTENKTAWKLTDADIDNWIISDLYSNAGTGTTYLYIHQQVNGIRIFNAVSSVSIKDGQVKSFAKRLFHDAAGKINTVQPSTSAVTAIQKAAIHLGLTMSESPKLVSANKSSHKYYYSSPALSKEKIRVELVYQPVKKSLRLAWDVNIHLIDNSHWWNVRIDAVNGEVLDQNDWVKHCDFGAPSDNIDLQSLNPASTNQQPSATNNQSSLLPGYLVYPLPLEAPSFGPSVLLSNPADAVASPFGWHDTNGIAGAEYTITRGNNVYAYDDIANQNAPGTSPDGTASLTFNFPVNFSQQPVTYLDASITNLFYINNMLHDRLVHYGFDEASGNFQETNYSGNGAGNDYVFAECQDGGGTNNANFATPDDGQNGRMQMYLWSGAVQSVIVVNSPAPIAGNYNAMPAGFGPSITSPITADLVLVDDGNGITSDACEPLVNGPALAGKIAVIDRGICNFVDKVLLAQNAGAVAVIMVNNVPGIMSMGDNGNGGSVTIPSEMISLSDGNIIKNSMSTTTVNATMNPPPSSAVDIDGSLDNGIVMHEFGHGVSTRLTGGPMNSSCLDNGEEGGEGWSDFFALMFTTPVGSVGTAARGMGTYALGEPTNGYGIRRYPYSTDMAIDPETYGFLSQSPEVHDIGEVWCTVLWEMNWALIGQYGFDPDWINGTSGNNITLKLVMEGFKLQPCGPGFIDARDAILQADDNLYGGIHKCLIWEAFAKRGMGFYANQGDANTAGDETEDFSLPPFCLIPTSSPTAGFYSDITNTCFGIIHFTDSSYNTPQSWRWDFGDGDTSIIQNPSHIYTGPGTYNVTLIVTNTLGADTLVRNGYITVSSPSAPAISGDTVICSGTATTLNATVLSGNVAEWRDANDSVIFVGTPFITPLLTSPVTYHVTQYAPTIIQHVGPVDNSFGNGGPHNSSFEGRLLFTTLVPLRIKSALVYATGTGIRNVNLYGPGNTLIQSLPVNIPDGQSRIDLNFDLQALGNYQIGVDAGSNLYRNTSGATYPYMINGIVSITSSNSTSNPASFYYYLYDWEVQELPCTSPSVPVNVTIENPVSIFSFSPTGLTVQFTNTSTGNPVSWSWDFGDGNTSFAQNPLVTYATPGNYIVSLTVTNADGCQSASSQLINVTPVGISSVKTEPFNIFYSGHELVINFQSPPGETRIRIYDPIGKLLINDVLKSDNVYTTKLQNISSEFILINLESGDINFSRKIILLN